MNATMKTAMEILLERAFTQFSREEDQGHEQIRDYVDGIVSDVNRYLRAYHDFKED